METTLQLSTERTDGIRATPDKELPLHNLWSERTDKPWGPSKISVDLVRLNLDRYRSRIFQEAAEWFVAIDVKRTIDDLVSEVDNDDPFLCEDAKDLLAAFGELAFKAVVNLLDHPIHWRDAVEVLSMMDELVVPHSGHREHDPDLPGQVHQTARGDQTAHSQICPNLFLEVGRGSRTRRAFVSG